jgi:hypothetical protein
MSESILIMGLDVRQAWPCCCGCLITRVAPYSKASPILIWKCAWCKKRRGRPAEIDVRRLKTFVGDYGWNAQPITLHEDGSVRIAYTTGVAHVA